MLQNRAPATPRLHLGGESAQNAHGFQDACSFRDWFAAHFMLDGKPYTLDLDQAGAVLDTHKNTLVTARAGSGKTRVIVAKVAYLIATGQMRSSEIVAFMFNRTAAAEVNERIAKVEFDGRPIAQEEIKIASTFHKFALDLLKLSGARPEIISEAEHDQLVRQALRCALAAQQQRVANREFEELLQIITGFVARSGQKYAGAEGLAELRRQVADYATRQTDADKVRLHQIALATFENYLSGQHGSKTDFNNLMHQASELLQAAPQPVLARVASFRMILIDEYQDFSKLFLDLVQALRGNCPSARLFAVGDDWQAINRFAGSDVEYFINFARYFPEDATNIPLMTNYRSCRRIVENANDYMLKHYDPTASRAVPFNRQSGKIVRRNPERTRFNASDIHEDGLGDGRYQLALRQASAARVQDTSAARLLKAVAKILRQNRRSEIMLLHRHNFTTFTGVTLEGFYQALAQFADAEGIMSRANFERQVRCMTMHKSKGLEAEVVILLEANRDLVLGHHPNADLWELFSDNAAIEKADQHRLLYVAMTRAKRKLYVLSVDKRPPV